MPAIIWPCVIASFASSVSRATFRSGNAMLARWWRWSLRDIDDLTMEEWREAVEDAASQIEAYNDSLKK